MMRVFSKFGDVQKSGSKNNSKVGPKTLSFGNNPIINKKI